MYNVAGLGTFYALVNCLTVVFLRNGEPLYWFLPWSGLTDWQSPLVCFAIITIFSGVFSMTAMFDEAVTGRSVEPPKKVTSKS